MSATLEDLRSEHEAEFIGPKLLALVERVARATALSYPRSYSGVGVWNDESIADALQGWVADRLWGRRDLTNLLAGAASLSALRSGLTRSFSQYLTSRRERTSATNLYARTVKMLRTDATFAPVGISSKPNEQLWTLASDPKTGPSTADLHTRLVAAAALTNDDLNVVRYGATSLKSSPVLREPTLKVFLEHLLAQLGALTPADIIEIMRRRFGLLEPESVELVAELDAPEPSPHDIASQSLITQSVAARLNHDDSRLLSTLAAEEDLKAAAKACATTDSAIRAAYKRMEMLVIEEAVEPSEVDHICGLILGLLHPESRNSV